MKVNTKQMSAKVWTNTLNKLNSAQIGQIAITYKGDDGKKQLGYIALTDIELDLGKKKITLGNLLGDLIKSDNEITEVIDSLKNDLRVSELRADKFEARIKQLENYVVIKEGGQYEKDII